jgi:uncharacterized protein (DUF2342 family)
MSNNQIQVANTITDILDVEPAELKLAPGQEFPVDYEKIKEDAEYARQNIRKAIEVGREAIKDVFELAKMSQDGRAYRVLKELIEGQVAASKTLIDTIEVAQRVASSNTEANNTPTTINNNLMLSTNDFLKMIDAAKEKK